MRPPAAPCRQRDLITSDALPAPAVRVLLTATVLLAFVATATWGPGDGVLQGAARPAAAAATSAATNDDLGRRRSLQSTGNTGEDAVAHARISLIQRAA